LPIQRPIPIWFGGGVDAVLRRAAKYGQGWIPLGRPDEQIEDQLARLRGYLEAEGRDPGAFGIEAWVRSGSGGPDAWRTAAERWAALGATHVTFYTSGQGIGAVAQQIEAMKQFRDVVR
jgi:alkanesulfonate monooxygenase SsuD/methylene tetrahydromethanopterin reductase-like flavin-dependent oxidoreductase (luciferase family)